MSISNVLHHVHDYFLLFSVSFIISLLKLKINTRSNRPQFTHHIAWWYDFICFSADELVITELLFNNVFRDLTPQQCCALLSCLVFDEKANEMPKLTEELSGPLRQLQVISMLEFLISIFRQFYICSHCVLYLERYYNRSHFCTLWFCWMFLSFVCTLVRGDHKIIVWYLQDTARRIAKVSLEAKLDITEDDYVDKFKPFMMDIVHAWCNGATFSQLCNMSEIFEGKVR